MTVPQNEACPLSGFLNIFGDAWTWVVVKEAFEGTKRFNDFQRNTGMARNVLSDRLSRLITNGILSKTPAGPKRFSYELTARGRSLRPLMQSMSLWSKEHIAIGTSATSSPPAAA